MFNRIKCVFTILFFLKILVTPVIVPKRVRTVIQIDDSDEEDNMTTPRKKKQTSASIRKLLPHQTTVLFWQ